MGADVGQFQHRFLVPGERAELVWQDFQERAVSPSSVNELVERRTFMENRSIQMQPSRWRARMPMAYGVVAS